MIARIIEWSIRWRILVISMTLGIAVVGVYAALQLPIDAVPDVTSNQVQINSVAPAFTPEEMEQYVTAPLEVALSSLPTSRRFGRCRSSGCRRSQSSSATRSTSISRGSWSWSD